MQRQRHRQRAGQSGTNCDLLTSVTTLTPWIAKGLSPVAHVLATLFVSGD